MTTYRGIDYSGPGSNVNRNPETGIRYGVISMNALDPYVWEDVEPIYPEEAETECPECKMRFSTDIVSSWDKQTCPECDHEFRDWSLDCLEPCGNELNASDYETQGPDEYNDVFVLKSPYKTRAQFCSPCAPGACHLENPCPTGEWAYCFGPDMFEDNYPPYDVYSVETGELVCKAYDPTKCQVCGETLDKDCSGKMRCPTCDGPCPGCNDGPGPV